MSFDSISAAEVLEVFEEKKILENIVARYIHQSPSSPIFKINEYLKAQSNSSTT
jgi:hypothetical protein